jgi:hypothetical protein
VGFLFESKVRRKQREARERKKNRKKTKHKNKQKKKTNAAKGEERSSSTRGKKFPLHKENSKLLGLRGLFATPNFLSSGVEVVSLRRRRKKKKTQQHRNRRKRRERPHHFNFESPFSSSSPSFFFLPARWNKERNRLRSPRTTEMRFYS